MAPTWGPPGSCRPQVDPMLATWTLLSGIYVVLLPNLSSFRKRHVNVLLGCIVKIMINLSTQKLGGKLANILGLCICAHDFFCAQPTSRVVRPRCFYIDGMAGWCTVREKHMVTSLWKSPYAARCIQFNNLLNSLAPGECVSNYWYLSCLLDTYTDEHAHISWNCSQADATKNLMIRPHWFS